MPKQDRAALVRATFDAHVSLLFVTSQQEQAGAISSETRDSLRLAFRNHMEKHWPEWQEQTRRYSDDKLHGMLEDYSEQLNCLGLLQWEKEQEKKPKQTLKEIFSEWRQDANLAAAESLQRDRLSKELGPREDVQSKPKQKDRGMER